MNLNEWVGREDRRRLLRDMGELRVSYECQVTASLIFSFFRCLLQLYYTLAGRSTTLRDPFLPGIYRSLLLVAVSLLRVYFLLSLSHSVDRQVYLK
jgi:hypothetical protein